MLFRNKQLCTLLVELKISFILHFKPVNARNKTLLGKKKKVCHLASIWLGIRRKRCHQEKSRE